MQIRQGLKGQGERKFGKYTGLNRVEINTHIPLLGLFVLAAEHF